MQLRRSFRRYRVETGHSAEIAGQQKLNPNAISRSAASFALLQSVDKADVAISQSVTEASH